MYVRDLIRSLLRRWYLVVAGLLLTVGLAFAAFTLVPVTYQAKGSVLLLPPASSVGQRGNPYLYLGGLAQAVEVLSARINATEVIKPIQDAHPDAMITIGQDVESTGPIVAVTVTSTTAADTTSTVEQVITVLPTTLGGMQDQLDVPDSSRITSIRLTNDVTVTAITKSRDRAVIAIGGIGVAGTLLLTGLIDGLLLGRLPRLRRTVEPAPGWELDGEPKDKDKDKDKHEAEADVPPAEKTEGPSVDPENPLPPATNGHAHPLVEPSPVPEPAHRGGSDRTT